MSVAVPDTAGPPDARQLFIAAYSAKAAGDYDEAIRLLTLAADTLRTNNGPALTPAAQASHTSEEPEAPILGSIDVTSAPRKRKADTDDETDAVSPGPKTTVTLCEVLLALGRIHKYGKGDHDNALRAFLEALSLRPRDPNLCLAIASEKLELKLSEDARTYAEQAVDIDSTSAKAQLFLGKILYCVAPIQDLARARQHLEAAIKLNNDQPEAHWLLGSLLDHEQNFVGARRHYNQVVSLAPKDYKSRTALGFLYEKLAQTDNAIAYFQGSLAVNDQQANVHAHLGELLESRNELVTARQHYGRCVDIEPNTYSFTLQFVNFLARHTRSRDDLNMAREVLNRFLLVNPTHFEAHKRLAALLLSPLLNLDGVAASHYDEALKHAPSPAERYAVSTELLKIYEKHGLAPDRVIQCLRQLLEFKSDDYANHLKLAAMLFDRREHTDEAIVHTKQGIALPPANAFTTAALLASPLASANLGVLETASSRLIESEAYAEANEVVRYLLQRLPMKASVYVQLGLISLCGPGDIASAEKCFRHAWDIDKLADYRVPLALISIFNRTGRDQALFMYDAAIQVFPTNVEVVLAMAAHLSDDLLRHDQAIALLHGLLVRDHMNYRAHMAIAGVFQNKLDMTSALAHYLETLVFNPACVDARINVAILLESVVKQPLLAYYHLLEVLRVEPDHVVANFLCGKIEAHERKDPSAARRHFERALAVNPTHCDVSSCAGDR